MLHNTVVAYLKGTVNLADQNEFWLAKMLKLVGKWPTIFISTVFSNNCSDVSSTAMQYGS